jgi:ABC-2 type transport system permease protein
VRGIFVVARRELSSLWNGALAPSLLVTFSLVQGGIFASLLLGGERLGTTEPVRAFFGQDSLLVVITLLLLCPALCMRSLAEERKSGSYEYLLASPLSSLDICLGKFLAPLATYAAIWAATLPIPFFVSLAAPVDWRSVVVSYLGVLLVGASQLSISLFSSALAKNQLTAFLFAAMAIFGTYVFSLGEFVYAEGVLRDLASHLSISSFLDETARGILDSRRVVLHVSILGFFLLSTREAIDSWREE